MIEFTDKVQPIGVRYTDDGYLTAYAPVARAGVQIYRGAEVDKPEMPFVRVYRPEDEVFSTAALRSYAHRPMTNDHPGEDVTADNWKQYAIGQTGDEVLRDGEKIRVPLVMMDRAAIDDFKAGKRELSMGYRAMLDWSSGVTEDGLEYDAVQRNLRMNHVALVSKGRASNARIGDRTALNSPTPKPEGHPMADNLRKVMVDGLSVETTDQGAEAISKLQSSIADAEKKVTDAEARHAEALKAKDKELATRDAEIEKLKSQVLTADALDKRVAERAELISTAKAIHDADYSGMEDAAIRAAVVKAKVGEDKVKGQSEAYIDARFDVLAEDLKAGKGDAVRKALADKSGTPVADADTAYADYVNALQSGTYHNAPKAAH